MAAEPSTDEQAIDATIVPEPQPSKELEAHVPTREVAMAPEVSPELLIDRLKAIEETADKAMTENVDYGKIPGTDKPTLLKPGAEKLAVLFKLDVQPRAELIREGAHLTVFTKATVFDIQTGARLGFGEGACSTRERKYGKRRQKPKCPDCKEETIFKSKRDPEFYCWAKKGGCGHTFKLDDKRITDQETGDIENPDLPDTWNTVIKMAEKRARVNAVLAVTGASAIFTQDVEDNGVVEDAAQPTAGGGGFAYGRPMKDADKKVLLDWLALLLFHEDQELARKSALELIDDIKREAGDEIPYIVAFALIKAGQKLQATDPAQLARAEADRGQAAAEEPDPPPPSDVPGDIDFESLSPSQEFEDDIPF